MSTIMPFDFLWCYEPEDDDEEEYCGCLLLGTPETVSPLHIDITNIIPDKTITIHPIAGITEADGNNYHFKFAFAPGILVEPEKIAIEADYWSLYQEADNLYLLWTGEAITLENNQITEVILTGVAAKSAVRTTTTTVTISWQFKQGTIDIINVSRIPGQGNDYANQTTLELEMIKTSGKSNIPLYVGFVGSNKVMNTNNETSNFLQLRITNTNLPGIENPNITFHYDTDAAQCSQLVVVLEVGDSNDVPWALGEQGDVNNITIDLNEQWQKKGETEEIKVNGVVKALQWTFIPQSADVVLQPQETLLIDLSNIKTAHPTGEANLYLRYQYIEGYKNGQFICQIEKAPLVFDNKVRMGTRKELDGLITVKDGISIDSPGEIQHTGTLIFRSDVDNSNDVSSVKFFNKKDESNPLMELKSDRVSAVNGPNATTQIETKEILELRRPSVSHVKNSNTAAFKVGSFMDGIEGRTQLDIALSGSPNESTGWGKIADKTVMSLQADGNVGIGTTSPSAKLDVQGDTVISSNTTIKGNTTIPNGYLSFNQQNGQLIQLWDPGHTIGIQGSTTYFRTSDHFAWYKHGSHSDSPLDAGGGTVQMVIKNGNVGIGTNNPSAKLDVHNGKIRINGGPVMKYHVYSAQSHTKFHTEYLVSEWQALVVGFKVLLDDDYRKNNGIEVRPIDNSPDGKWFFTAFIAYQESNMTDIILHVLFIRKELFD